MNELQIFKNDEFGSIRTLEIKNEPWFVGKDIAKVLGYSKPLNAIATHVDKDDSLKQGLTDSLGRSQETIIINESGLYSLILSSKLPTAKKFKRWVTSEVLPAIRKHGAYLTDQKAYDITHNKDALADLLLQAANQLKEKDLVIQEMKPKALFADAVASSNKSILVRDLAKLLHQNGVAIGEKRLFVWLRENGYLCKTGYDRNMPTQKSRELGLFETKVTTIVRSDGSVQENLTPKVTGKGQIYFMNKFCGKTKAGD